MDDGLWYDALICHKWWMSKRATAANPLPAPMIAPESFLWGVLGEGIFDFHKEDGQWESSYRAMRHGSAIGTMLWMMWEQEKNRVRLLVLCGSIAFANKEARRIVWSRRPST